MLDIECVITPESAVSTFRVEATQWTLARDRYLAGILPFKGLVEATRLLLARTYRAMTRLELSYADVEGYRVFTEVMVHTRAGEAFPLPGVDYGDNPAGPPWFTDPTMRHIASQMNALSFEETGRVLSDWLDGITADYDDVMFTLLALAFVARDSEGELTELIIR